MCLITSFLFSSFTFSKEFTFPSTGDNRQGVSIHRSPLPPPSFLPSSLASFHSLQPPDTGHYTGSCDWGGGGGEGSREEGSRRRSEREERCRGEKEEWGGRWERQREEECPIERFDGKKHHFYRSPIPSDAIFALFLLRWIRFLKFNITISIFGIQKPQIFKWFRC